MIPPCISIGPQISPNEVCGCPLDPNFPCVVLDPLEVKFCRQPKRSCTRHFCWERLRRAEIDQEKLNLVGIEPVPLCPSHCVPLAAIMPLPLCSIGCHYAPPTVFHWLPLCPTHCIPLTTIMPLPLCPIGCHYAPPTVSHWLPLCPTHCVPLAAIMPLPLCPFGCHYAPPTVSHWLPCPTHCVPLATIMPLPLGPMATIMPLPLGPMATIIVPPTQYLKLEDVSEQIRINQWQIENRGSLLPTLLHHTVDHTKGTSHLSPWRQ